MESSRITQLKIVSVCFVFLAIALPIIMTSKFELTPLVSASLSASLIIAVLFESFVVFSVAMCVLLSLIFASFGFLCLFCFQAAFGHVMFVVIRDCWLTVATTSICSGLAGYYILDNLGYSGLSWNTSVPIFAGIGFIVASIIIICAYTFRLLIVRGVILPASMSPFFSSKLLYRNLNLENIRQNMSKQGWKLLNITTSDNVSINVAKYHNSSVSKKCEDKKWILMFLGNGGLFELHSQESMIFSKEFNCNIMTMNYRGVCKSGGVALYDQDLVIDGMACLKHLILEEKARPENILLYGHSLGGSVAALMRAEMEKSPPTWLLSSGTFEMCPLLLDRTFISLPSVPLSVLSPVLARFGNKNYFLRFLRVSVPWIMSNLGWTLDVGNVWKQSTKDLSCKCVILFHKNDDIIRYSGASLYSGLTGIQDNDMDSSNINVSEFTSTITGGAIASASRSVSDGSGSSNVGSSNKNFGYGKAPINGPANSLSIELLGESRSPHNMPLMNDQQWPVVVSAVQELFRVLPGKSGKR